MKARLTLFCSIGIGASKYYNYYLQFQERRRIAIFQEEQRLRRNRELMEAYGYKDSLDDVTKALDMYKK